MITLEQLAHIVPNGKRAPLFLDPLNHAMQESAIDTPRRQAAFVAECAHESAEFTRLIENLNYSADGLLQTFGKRFTPEEAEQYARHPERIANRVYANRMGNGDEFSGDGWKYRGRGLIHVTGRDNYKAVGLALGLPLLTVPMQLEEPWVACRASATWWKAHGCNELADADNFLAITKRVNGGTNGYHERLAYYENALSALNQESVA